MKVRYRYRHLHLDPYERLHQRKREAQLLAAEIEQAGQAFQQAVYTLMGRQTSGPAREQATP